MTSQRMFHIIGSAACLWLLTGPVAPGAWAAEKPEDFYDEVGRLLSPQDLQQYWSEVATADEIIVYCGSGVTACVNLFALEAAGIQTGKLYVGSWSDWCSYLLDSPSNGLQ